MKKDSRPKKRPVRAAAGPREVKVYGVHAAAAVFAHRKDDIIRAYVEKGATAKWREVMKYCAAERKAYHIVSTQELQKVSGSEHSEGICLLAKERQAVTLEQFTVFARTQKAPAAVVVCDGVTNPHNLGAILRSAAHFGVFGLVIAGEEPVSLSGSLLRVSEGAAENVVICQLRSSVEALEELRKLQFRIVATSATSTAQLYSTILPERIAFVYGAERTGIQKTTKGKADLNLCIPGSGLVESLNVSTAAAVSLGEWWRQHRSGRGKRK